MSENSMNGDYDGHFNVDDEDAGGNRDDTKDFKRQSGGKAQDREAGNGGSGSRHSDIVIERDDDADDDDAEEDDGDEHTKDGVIDGPRDAAKLTEKVAEYLKDLLKERTHIDQEKCPMADRFLEEGKCLN